jgi:hypothetical protein
MATSFHGSIGVAPSEISILSVGSAETTTHLRGRVLYVYESYHGFLFFLSTVLFVAFWYSLYRYYGHSYGTSPQATTAGQGGMLSRFSSRPKPNQSIVVLTGPMGPASTGIDASKKGDKFDGMQNGNSGQPVAAYLVDNYGRQSMIPTAVAVEVQPKRPTGVLDI